MLAQLLCIVMSVTLLLAGSGCRAADIKEPAVAGTFYPGDAETLKKSVDRFMAATHPDPAGLRPVALVVPHAGYVYSGAVAAEGFARLQGRPVSTVILIGPSHHVPFSGAAIYPGDGLRTPLGVLDIDRDMARSLVNEADHIRFDAAPFVREHSLEVQLPFIQRVLGPKTRIVPILLGQSDRESLAALPAAIGRMLRKDPHALLVISTDLSHYHDEATAKIMDARVIDTMERLSTHDLERLLRSREGEMCGGWPVIYGMAAARAAGASHGISYRRATSGDVNGASQSVVGYVSLGMVRDRLDAARKKRLLELAQKAVSSQVRGEKLPDGVSGDPIFNADGAVFVTLNGPDGRLRGCVGTIQPRMSLVNSVIKNAVSAAASDPRFLPVRPDELPGLHVEVTILSPLEGITDVKDIVIGRHGLYLEKEGKSSVFLPQVAVEQQWNLMTYLAQLAVKAGLPADGWQGARLSVFTAEIVK